MRRAILATSLILGAAAAGQLEAQGIETTIGSVIAMGTKFCPPGWEQANGQMVPISEYVDLFYVIGTTYGGDGQSTFALPNFKGGTYGPAKQPITWCIAVTGQMPPITKHT